MRELLRGTLLSALFFALPWGGAPASAHVERARQMVGALRVAPVRASDVSGRSLSTRTEAGRSAARRT